MGRGSSGGGSRIGSRMGGNMIKSVDSFGRPQYHSGTSKGAKSIGANQLMKNWDKAKASKSGGGKKNPF